VTYHGHARRSASSASTRSRSVVDAQGCVTKTETFDLDPAGQEQASIQAAKLHGHYNITVLAFGAVVVLLGWVAIILGT
jgi:hypothetical protein